MLGVVVGISLAIHLIVLVALAIAGNSASSRGALDSVVLQVVIQFFIVTGTSLGVEQALPTYALVHRIARPPSPRPSKPKKWRVSRLESIAQIVWVGVLLAWLGLVSERPFRGLRSRRRYLSACPDLVAGRPAKPR